MMQQVKSATLVVPIMNIPKEPHQGKISIEKSGLYSEISENSTIGCVSFVPSIGYQSEELNIFTHDSKELKPFL